MPLRRGITGSVVFALLWVLLAIARPTSTFHLAPLVVAVWPALGHRQPSQSTWSAAIGLGIAGMATLVLSVTGLLQGPSLLPWGGPALESLTAALAGSVIGVASSLLRRRGPA